MEKSSKFSKTEDPRAKAQESLLAAAGRGAPPAVAAREVVVAEPGLVAAETEIRRRVRLVAGAAGVHVMLGKPVDAEADDFHVGHESTAVLLGHDLLGVLDGIAEKLGAVFHVEDEVRLGRHLDDVLQLVRIQVGVTDLTPVLDHGHLRIDGQVNLGNDRQERNAVVFESHLLGPLDDRSLLLLKHLDDGFGAAAVLERFDLAREELDQLAFLDPVADLGDFVLGGLDHFLDFRAGDAREELHQLGNQTFFLVLAKHVKPPFGSYFIGKF